MVKVYGFGWLSMGKSAPKASANSKTIHCLPPAPTKSECREMILERCICDFGEMYLKHRLSTHSSRYLKGNLLLIPIPYILNSTSLGHMK